MRVALDATPLALTTGGLARYTAELSRALADRYPEGDFVLLSDQAFTMPAPPRGNLRAGGRPRNALERRWWLWGAQRAMGRLGCDLFHGTNFEVPYLPLRPSVVTVLDLSPWMNPEWHHAADRVRRRTPPLLGMGIATMIITPTRAVRAQVVESFGVAPARVVAVPLGASDVFRPVEARAPAASPAAAPYFLYVGTLEPRKNLDGLIEAWREVRGRHGVDLVLAGRRRADFSELPPEPGLRVTGEVSDTDLAQLYSGALALVYPSHYEGFGLPVLEAMQCGACVLISKDAALCEVAGEAGVNLDGAQAWAEAMCAVASNPEWRHERRAKSLARARGFSWTRTAQLTYDVYEEALKRF
jgi:glycosyltransferase involved in cell wall biosynthesis